MTEGLQDGKAGVAVHLRTSTGQSRYLLVARREPCARCTSGTRTISIWATARGRGEAIEWCSHCFDATCQPIRLEDEHRERHQAVRSAVAEGKVSGPWHAVRPALEDLERRGLL